MYFSFTINIKPCIQRLYNHKFNPSDKLTENHLNDKYIYLYDKLNIVGIDISNTGFHFNVLYYN